MIVEIKETVFALESCGTRLQIYSYLQEQWEKHADSAELSVLVIQQMVSFLLDLESPWGIPESDDEYQWYYDFLQKVLKNSMQHHCTDKMVLWQICYYLCGIATFHFLCGETITFETADRQLRALLHQAEKLFPNSKLFLLIPAFQHFTGSMKLVKKSDLECIGQEVAEWNLQKNAADQEMKDLFNSLEPKE